MTFRTIGWELLGYVIRISSLCKIIIVTTIACVRGIVVVTIMAGSTVVGNGRMRSEQLVIVIVYGECGRCPSRIGSVAGFTSRWQVQRQVIRVDTLVVVRCMTSRTGVGGVAVIPLMTVVASRTRVRARKRPEAVVKS